MDGCVTPDVPVQSLEHFFLSNLEQDVIALSSSLGRSVDDAVLTVHLVLKKISQMSDQDFPGNLYGLHTYNSLYTIFLRLYW